MRKTCILPVAGRNVVDLLGLQRTQPENNQTMFIAGRHVVVCQGSCILPSGERYDMDLSRLQGTQPDMRIERFYRTALRWPAGYLSAFP